MVAKTRQVVRTASLDVIRAEPCVAPEGLYHLDGWLYFGGWAMGQVKRVHLETGAVEVVCAPPLDNNSRYIKIAVSDGTFGPRGTVFAWTWSIAHYGMPTAHLPNNGGTWKYSSYAKVSRGKGGSWDSLGYASAGGVGTGFQQVMDAKPARAVLLSGSSEEGLVQISKALPTDTVPDSIKYKLGELDYKAAGHTLIHGRHGFSPHGFALPWGETPEMDYYLEWQGHKRER